MSTISAVLDQLVIVQEALAITSPMAAAVRKAFKFFPEPTQELPGDRVFQNEWSMQPLDTRRLMSMRELVYTVRTQFLAGSAQSGDVERTEAICTAFWEKLIEALYPLNTTPAALTAALSLNGTCTIATLRGGEPTLGVIQRGGKAYIGFEAFLELRIEAPFVFGG